MKANGMLALFFVYVEFIATTGLKDVGLDIVAAGLNGLSSSAPDVT